MNVRRVLLAPRGVQIARFVILTLALTLSVAVSRQVTKDAHVAQFFADPLPAQEFSRIVQDSSEEGGYFHSDNFTSNESGYLTVVGKLRELGASGGAYLGVGPEQNFTYIAKIRPKIAFIIDIRRQAIIQHLMYKAIFQLADNRAQFLSLLFSKPLAGMGAPGRNASVRQLIGYFAEGTGREQDFVANLSKIGKTIRETFKFALSAPDQSSLEYVYGAFREGGLAISFRRGQYGGRFPTMRDLIEQPGSDGKPGNYLASEDDYEFVRDLQRANRVIPVVGDFGGPKAIRAVGSYLRKNSYTVTAFYTSNVEQFLFQNGIFGAYADNIKSLPIAENSLFIRAAPNMWLPRQAPYSSQNFGRRMGTQLERMSVFLKDYEDGVYIDYGALLGTHAIFGDQ